MKRVFNLILFAIISLLFIQLNLFAYTESEYFRLEREPLVRIGLIENASSVSITTTDTSLVAESIGEPKKYLGTTSLRISSRSYNPPTFEVFHVEIRNISTRETADQLAARIRSETSQETAVLYGETPETWKIRIGTEKYIVEDARDIQTLLTEKEFAGVEIVTEKFTSPSDESVELTKQLAQTPKSEVRSIISTNTSPFFNQPESSNNVRTISSSQAIRKNMNAIVNRSLREVVVSGNTEASKFSDLKSVVVGSMANRGIVKLNGKSYRGMMEVFGNAKGGITVVNVVPMEDYLLGVVPAELSLPQLEAQKAQAVAARTYAIANANGYGEKGYDMLPTVWSQVYKGVSIESQMGTQAVLQTRGVFATYQGKPINALYTSTCGGRTEDSGNIFEFNEPYLRGVNCSLEGKRHFAPFLIKSTRQIANIRNEANYEMVRLASKLSVNNYLLVTNQFTDDYFEDAPTEIELKSWLNNLAVKFGKPFPQFVTADSAKPLLLANVLANMIYDDPLQSDTLLSESDINYQLSFLDAGEVPKQTRPILAMLMRDGWFSIYSDLTIKPQKHYSRAKILRLIDYIYNKKKWTLDFDSGEARPTEDGKLILKSGRSEKQVTVNPNVFLFRKFGDAFYQVKETALLGGEKVHYKTNGLGEVIYLEIEPTDETTVAEKMSPFTYWNKNLSASSVRSLLSRYVKGMGSLIDVRIAKQGFSKRAIDLEIVTTNGTQHLKGGAIRSALRLREQLFVMNKRYDSNGRVVSFNFVGRGWGHGVGMCQYGAYGLAKMGVKYDEIVKHYYNGIELTRAY